MVDLRKHLATGDGRDRFWGVDGVVGSSFDDVLIGDDSGNMLLGCGGADLLVGKSGPDWLQGDDFDADPDHCPGESTDNDMAAGGRGGPDFCAAETMRGCGEKDADPTTTRLWDERPNEYALGRVGGTIALN